MANSPAGIATIWGQFSQSRNALFAATAANAWIFSPGIAAGGVYCGVSSLFSHPLTDSETHVIRNNNVTALVIRLFQIVSKIFDTILLAFRQVILTLSNFNT